MCGVNLTLFGCEEKILSKEHIVQWSPEEPSWAKWSPVESSWAKLSQVWQLWQLLVLFFGNFWQFLVSFGIFCQLLATFDNFWQPGPSESGSEKFEKWKVKKETFTLFRQVQSENTIKMLQDRDREVKILKNSWQFSRNKIFQQNYLTRRRRRPTSKMPSPTCP